MLRKVLKTVMVLIMFIGIAFSISNFMSVDLTGKSRRSGHNTLNERALVLDEDGENYICDGDGNEC